MARFSATGAATAGFRVIGRAPLAVLAWGLLLLVALIGPMVGVMWTLVPQFIEIFKAMPDPSATPAGSTDPAMMAQMMRLQFSMMGVNLLSWVGGTLVQAVVAGAVFRAVLEPDQKRWAYMRLGKSELWLVLVTLVQGVLFMMAYFALLIVCGILSAIVIMTGSAMGDGGKLLAVLLIVLLVLAAFGTLIWGLLRVSMAGPMSFVEQQFRLFESWNFTRGQSGRLLGMAALLVLIVFALEMVLYAIVGGGVLIGMAYGAGKGLAEILESLKGQPPQAWLRVFWPLAALGAVVLSFVSALLLTLVCAPWAKAYQELAASGASAD